MPLVHDTAVTIGDIFEEVTSNLFDAGQKWFSSDDILNSIQEQYNKIVALMCPIEYSTFIPKINSSYYSIGDWIGDFMYVSAIFNPTTNLWLQGRTYKTFKSGRQTYYMVGEPRFFNIMDFKKVLIWPYLPTPSGVLYLIYKAKAPQIATSHIPILPHSTGSQILEYLTTGDLLEQSREFKKAAGWFDKVFKPASPLAMSIWEQCKVEVKSLARMDRETVLEPYRWMFHGGQFNDTMWINNETPSGTKNGVNATFTLSQVPNPTSSLILMLNGQILINSQGYSLSGQSITISSPFAVAATDSLQAWFQVA